MQSVTLEDAHSSPSPHQSIAIGRAILSLHTQNPLNTRIKQVITLIPISDRLFSHSRLYLTYLL
jgi:hypothetical protein